LRRCGWAVSAQALSLFRGLLSRFVVDPRRFLDYAGRAKSGRGRCSCASFHGAVSSGDEGKPAFPADTWASATARWCRRLVVRAAHRRWMRRGARLSNSRSCSSLLAAIAARRCGATSLAFQGEYDGHGLQGGCEAVDRGGPGPSSSDGVGEQAGEDVLATWPLVGLRARTRRKTRKRLHEPLLVY